MIESSPIWPIAEKRIRLHQQARVELPECSPEERWATSDQWALMKEGRKTAIKLYDTESEAQVALSACGPKHFVERRLGRDIRCADYCPVSKFCQQHLTAIRGFEDKAAE